MGERKDRPNYASHDISEVFGVMWLDDVVWIFLDFLVEQENWGKISLFCVIFCNSGNWI